MKHTINLDQIICKVNDRASRYVKDEEVIVRIDLSQKKSVEKTFLGSLSGNYCEYLIYNQRNPMRTGSGSLSSYYVNDAIKKRTLSLEVDITSCFCPVGAEIKAAEALHGEQSPSHIFASLLERWVREFIAPGSEGQFIDSYNTAHQSLEKHLTLRASTLTGLEIRPKVFPSAEKTTPNKIAIAPVEINLRLQDLKQQQILKVETELSLDQQNFVKAYVFQEGAESPENIFKNCLKEHFNSNVSFKQYIEDLQKHSFRQLLLQSINVLLAQAGWRANFINLWPVQESPIKPPPNFIHVHSTYNHKIIDRIEDIVIHNTVHLYCENHVSYISSGITDLEAWVKSELNKIFKRYLIGKTYVDILLRFPPIEQGIKKTLSARAAEIGYQVDHLVSIRHLKELDLNRPFDLSFEDTFETKLDNFEVQLKFNINLCLQDLQAVEKYLNRDADVKNEMKNMVLSVTRQILRNIHPERFYLYFHRSNEKETNSFERQAVENLLNDKIKESLQREFGANIIELTTRVGRTDLLERYKQLCFVIREFSVTVDTPDPHGTESLTLTGNFELRGVHSDSEGWQRFSTLRLDLDGLQTQLEKNLKSELKYIRQSDLMYQNYTAKKDVFDLIKACASQYMKEEFGLVIHLTNLDRNTTRTELQYKQMHDQVEDLKRKSTYNQVKLLTDKLDTLKKIRISLLSSDHSDQDELHEIERSISQLENELNHITKSRFGDHRLSETLETKQPDKLLSSVNDNQIPEKNNPGSGLKGQLTE